MIDINVGDVISCKIKEHEVQARVLEIDMNKRPALYLTEVMHDDVLTTVIQNNNVNVITKFINYRNEQDKISAFLNAKKALGF